MLLTVDQFKKLFPSCKNPQDWTDAFNEVLPKYDITGLRLAQMLAQCGHESGGFTVFTENLNYSRDGLLKVFPKYFNASNVDKYARKPQAIANRVYASRMNNGDESSGDGWKYRGRGILQATGKFNYSKFSQWYFGDDRCITDPDLMLDPTVSVAFVCWFWTTNNINRHADREDTTAVTKIINGGTHGLPDRLARYATAKKLLTLS